MVAAVAARAVAMPPEIEEVAEAVAAAGATGAGERVWSEREAPRTPGMRGDQRANMVEVFRLLLGKGSCSYTAGLGPASRQAAHRYFGAKTAEGEPRVSPMDVLSGHVVATAERCSKEPRVLVAQDTTAFGYPGHRKLKEKMAPLQRDDPTPGIWCHSALAMTNGGLLLGVVHLDMWMRDQESPHSRHDRHQRPTEEKESRKWLVALAAVEAALPEELELVMIADSEADAYDYLAAPRRANTHMVTRVCHPRYVTCSQDAGDGSRVMLTAAAKSAPAVATITVEVPARERKPARTATVNVSMCTVYLHPPQARKSSGDPGMRYQVVCALEPPGSCPEEDLVEWMLLTDLEVADVAAALEIIRVYRCRWQIEVLHKTMKSWLKAEQLQTEDPAETMNVLAGYFIVGWRALHLTYMARHRPEAPADTVLSQDEREVLEAEQARPITTVRDALRAITILGGHTPYKKGPPAGPKPLLDGLVKLDGMVRGWRLALSRLATLLGSDTR